MLNRSFKGPSLSMLVLVMGIAVLPTSCSEPKAPQQELPSYCYDEQKLTDELDGCPKRSSTLEESLACRARVNSACGYKVPQ